MQTPEKIKTETKGQVMKGRNMKASSMTRHEYAQARWKTSRNKCEDFQSDVSNSKHRALALLSVGEDELRHGAALTRPPLLLDADLHEATANGGAFVAADAVGSVGAIDKAVARSLLGCLPLGTNGTVGSSAQATDAGLARKASATSAANAIGVVVGSWKRHLSLTHWTSTAGAARALAAASDACTNKVAHSLSALTSSEVFATLMLARGVSLELL